ncbi:hypothetical protein [Agromyces seonyuensis]|uniref:Uncharacterized protein n=1 Tax=Agromyces seonyuensis TaxID=2662446 RepID=A0A6I4NWN8_9MICO|nr:hypothetical protein [Agromyces seonyuensis]MWB98591.1 hypothetical protein [Agromyces seonyuensis]
MASKGDEQPLDVWSDKAGLWGMLAGVITAALIAVPLSGAFAFATHPNSQLLFSGKLNEASQAGFAIFWWLATLLLLALPFLVGFGIAKLSFKGLAIVGGIVVVFIIALLVLGQLFLFV